MRGNFGRFSSTHRPIQGNRADWHPVVGNSDLRLELVAALREQIRSGTYRISSEDLAEVLLEPLLHAGGVSQLNRA